MASGLQDISKINHEYFMDIAIQEAEIAGQRGDKPIAALLVHENKIIGKSSNSINTRDSKVHHAENWLCLEFASFLKKHGRDSIIYTTLEPCIMCISTIIMADIRNVVVGYRDKYMNTYEEIQKMAWLRTRVNNYLMGIREDRCIRLVEDYMEERDKALLL